MSESDLPFVIEPDIIGGRYIRRSQDGEIESASAAEWLLYSRLLSKEARQVGHEVNEVTKLKAELVAAKARIAELEKLTGAEPEAQEAVEPAEKKPASRSRK